MLRRLVPVVLAMAAAVPAAHAATARAGAAGAAPEEWVLVSPTYESAANLYGTASQSVYTVRVEDFMPPTNTTAYGTHNTGGIYKFQSAGPTGDWWANVNLPTGAIVELVELQACDTSATGNMVFGLARMDAPAASGGNVTPVGNTGAAATPGCAFFSVTPSVPLVIDNLNKSYILFLDFFGDFTTANKAAAVRVFYRLQVSPAPATATFNDVPVGHPQHRFVEALAASGVTGGCGGGNYCPDNPVTRGQMAVFLSVALGLHFPN
jgi:hypothetical protein